jgi:hypothetical protein
LNTDFLTLIETGMADAIKGIRKADGFYFDWGTVNQPDQAKLVYPSASIMLANETCQDNAGGSWDSAYLQVAMYEIIVHTRLVEEKSVPLFEINTELNKALYDLKKLFGKNYNVSGACDTIMYQGCRRIKYQAGDIFVPKYMITNWRVMYTQDREEPNTVGD